MSAQSLLLGLGGNLLWQTLLIALTVFVIFKTLPRPEARLRYRIALTGLLGCSLLIAAPFLPNLMPTLEVGVTQEAVTAIVAPTAAPAEIITTSPAQYALNEIRREFPLGRILVGLWALGILFSLIRLSHAAVLGRRWIKSAAPVQLPAQLKLSRPVTLKSSVDTGAPLVLGFRRPVILVPTGFSVDDPGARAVLEHEIAHIDRGDLWMNLAQRLILAVLWWCAPLYWLNRQINTEREKLCDDIAATRLGSGRTLAKALLELAETQANTKNQLLAIGLHPRLHTKAGQLAERITRLCKETNMTKLSKKLLVASSLTVPAVIGSLVLLAPRAIAHSPVTSHSSGHAQMEDISSLQYALFMAASHGKTDEVRDLLGMGVDPVFHIHGDGSPLILASKHGHVDIARLLVTHGAKINRMTASDESPLINAVKSGSLPMVEYLVGAGADVSLGQVSNPMRRPERRSPLSTAKKYGHTKIAQYLQSQGAVMDQRKGGSSPVIQKIVEGRLTSKFGVKRERFGGKMHKGIDIANKEGTPILAPASGVITQVTDTYKGKKTWGHVVVMESEGHVETVFAHLKDSQVSPGQAVTQGQQIARLGNTGKTTGPHVHIQTQVRGALTDPLMVWPGLAP